MATLGQEWDDADTSRQNNKIKKMYIPSFMSAREREKERHQRFSLRGAPYAAPSSQQGRVCAEVGSDISQQPRLFDARCCGLSEPSRSDDGFRDSAWQKSASSALSRGSRLPLGRRRHCYPPTLPRRDNGGDTDPIPSTPPHPTLDVKEVFIHDQPP